jgi:hypothetical protein
MVQVTPMGGSVAVTAQVGNFVQVSAPRLYGKTV